jgi:hypothetical protein
MTAATEKSPESAEVGKIWGAPSAEVGKIDHQSPLKWEADSAEVGLSCSVNHWRRKADPALYTEVGVQNDRWKQNDNNSQNNRAERGCAGAWGAGKHPTGGAKRRDLSRKPKALASAERSGRRATPSGERLGARDPRRARRSNLEVCESRRSRPCPGEAGFGSATPGSRPS